MPKTAATEKTTDEPNKTLLVKNAESASVGALSAHRKADGEAVKRAEDNVDFWKAYQKRIEKLGKTPSYADVSRPLKLAEQAAGSFRRCDVSPETC